MVQDCTNTPTPQPAQGLANVDDGVFVWPIAIVVSYVDVAMISIAVAGQESWERNQKSANTAIGRAAGCCVAMAYIFGLG